MTNGQGIEEKSRNGSEGSTSTSNNGQRLSQPNHLLPPRLPPVLSINVDDCVFTRLLINYNQFIVVQTSSFHFIPPVLYSHILTLVADFLKPRPRLSINCDRDHVRDRHTAGPKPALASAPGPTLGSNYRLVFLHDYFPPSRLSWRHPPNHNKPLTHHSRHNIFASNQLSHPLHLLCQTTPPSQRIARERATSIWNKHGRCVSRPERGFVRDRLWTDGAVSTEHPPFLDRLDTPNRLLPPLHPTPLALHHEVHHRLVPVGRPLLRDLRPGRWPVRVGRDTHINTRTHRPRDHSSPRTRGRAETRVSRMPNLARLAPTDTAAQPS